MSENKFLVIGFGNMGSLHVKILTTLIPTVRFDIVDDQEIKIPALNVTSVTFVGKKLDYLFVTTANFELTKTQIKQYNYSGSSFIFKTNYQGVKIPYSNLKIKS